MPTGLIDIERDQSFQLTVATHLKLNRQLRARKSKQGTSGHKLQLEIMNLEQGFFLGSQGSIT